jgi:hypothetical protein
MSGPDPHSGTISKTLYVQLTDLRQGAKTAWPQNLTTITFQQQSVTQSQFDTQCADELEPFQTAKDAFATWQAALVTREASLEGAKKLIAGVYALLPGFLGRNSPNHAKWGAAPKKARRPLTSEQKVVAAEKSKATREARGTMSKKAKSKIHGTVPAAPTTPAPAATTPAPAAATTPAPAATAPKTGG